MVTHDVVIQKSANRLNDPYWSGVDKDDQEKHQQNDNSTPNDVPLVVPPDDVFEGLEWRGEPEE